MSLTLSMQRISLRAKRFAVAGMVLGTALAAAPSCRAADDGGRPDDVLSWRHQFLPQKEYARLTTEWEAYVKAHPNDVMAQVQWGNALRYAGEWDKAKDAYTRAFDADSNNAGAIEAYVSKVRHDDTDDDGDARLARSRLVRATRADPGYAVTYYALWLTSLRTGDRDLARDCLKKVIDLGDMPRPLVDFGYNMLASAPKDAVVLTNGDNDTYPPLAVQITTGFRTDVSIVNLSLLNLRWFVRMMRDDGVPIGLTDSEIAALRHNNDRTISAQALQALYETSKKNGWARPLFYSVTVVDQNKAVPSSRIVTGLLERIGPLDDKMAPAKEGSIKEGCAYDVDGTRRLLDTAFRLDTITDSTIDWKRENALAKLGMNYVPLLSEVGTALFQRTPPEDGAPYLQKAITIAIFHHRLDEAKAILEQWQKLEGTAP